MMESEGEYLPMQIGRTVTNAGQGEMPLKITSALELFRVQDARAALPQNCSPKKIKRCATFCLWHFWAISTPKVPLGYLAEIRVVAGIPPQITGFDPLKPL